MCLDCKWQTKWRNRYIFLVCRLFLKRVAYLLIYFFASCNRCILNICIFWYFLMKYMPWRFVCIQMYIPIYIYIHISGRGSRINDCENTFWVGKRAAVFREIIPHGFIVHDNNRKQIATKLPDPSSCDIRFRRSVTQPHWEN